MKTKLLALILMLLALCNLPIFAQYCGIKDPSLERYSSCPTSHSQLFSKSYHWFNVLNPTISTADYYHEGHSCIFGGFIAAGGIHISYCTSCFRNSCSNTFYEGCGRAGIFLNYNDGSQDPKYKEYIGTRVDLIRARSYLLSIDVQRSNDASSSNIERDLCIYGYSGALPTAQVQFCPTGAVPLDTISRSLFNNDTNNTILSNFVCPSNFSYLIIGPVCDNSDAIRVGYVYLDKILLSDTRDSTLTPWIKFAGKDSRACCFSGFKSEFVLVGNKAPVGTTVLWSQSTSNPQALVFSTPSDSSTSIVGTGYLTVGSYDFYYSWTKFGCTMIDTLKVNVLNNARANAGTDIVLCPGSSLTMNASAPTNSEIMSRGYLSWWSIVDPAKPGGIYTFPLSDPLRQSCISGPGALNYTLGYSPDNTVLPTSSFQSTHQADTFKFIWNIVDDCNNYSSDTVTTYSYQFLLDGDSTIICPGDTSGIIKETADSVYNFNHVSRSSWYYIWSIVADSGRAHLVGNIHGTSIRLTSNSPGYYTIQADVYDSTNTLCNHYVARVTVYVRDTIKLLHPRDIVLCGQSLLSIVQGGVPPGSEWWWDVIDYSQSDSLFTLHNPNFPLLPFDGDSNINVRSPIVVDSASPIPNDFYSIFVFSFRQPQDTFTLIYNVRNACSPYELRKDTVKVITNHVLISGGPPITCPGDTSIFVFETGHPVVLNSRNDSSLHYYWHQLSGAGIMNFDSLSARDSMVCNVQNIPGPYTVELILYDSDDSICPALYSSFTFNIISPIILDSVNAGIDVNVCNSLLTPYNLLMNARPSVATLNALGYESWWSLIDYTDADSEYVFNNGCEPGDGFDNGSVTCGFDLLCGSVTPFASDAPNCFFIVDKWGCYDFIWHVRFQCNGVTFYKDDTMRFCWDYLEPAAHAGLDDTVICNVYQLIGNTSAASAANNGCFQWHQIRSTTGIQIQIADSSSNIAYLLGLDTVAAGTYYFEYIVGCGTCSKRDTVAIYIPGSLPSPTINLTTSSSDIFLCPGDSATLTASGADQYQFFVNGISVSPLSSRNTFTNHTWQNDTNRISVIAYISSSGCFSSGNTSIIFVFHPLDSLQINSDSIIYCSGSRAYLKGNTPYSSQRIYWFSAADNFLTPINLPNGTARNDSFMVAPSTPTIYKATLYDTLTKCWSFDTLSVKVVPVIAALPNPQVPNDTNLCLTSDSISLQLAVFNHLYPGFWSAQSSSFVHFTNYSDPLTIAHMAEGSHLLIWTENNLGCEQSDSFIVTVDPYPSVNAGSDTLVCRGKQLELFGLGTASNYQWIPMDSVLLATSLSTSTRNIYTAYDLILEGATGQCKSRDTIHINTIDCPSDIKAPTAFSPNGDGNNDFFSVYTYQLKKYEIWIYNRWGEQMYHSISLDETNDLHKGWDGRYKGSTVDMGVYVFLIQGVNRDDEKLDLKGNVTVVK